MQDLQSSFLSLIKALDRCVCMWEWEREVVGSCVLAYERFQGEIRVCGGAEVPGLRQLWNTGPTADLFMGDSGSFS